MTTNRCAICGGDFEDEPEFFLDLGKSRSVHRRCFTTYIRNGVGQIPENKPIPTNK